MQISKKRSEDEEGNISILNWKHYKQYWQEKGKADFEEYVKKLKEEKDK